MHDCEDLSFTENLLFQNLIFSSYHFTIKEWTCYRNLGKKNREYSKTSSLSIQILQYEFLGPIPLNEWGPPMEKVVFLIMSRDQDKFNIIFVGNCEKTEESSFFTQSPHFKCWLKESITEKSLYLAILPLFESNEEQRKNVVKKIKVRYNPICNHSEEDKPKPEYKVRKMEKYFCPNCNTEQIMRNLMLNLILNIKQF